MRLYISSLIAFDRDGEYEHAPLFFSAENDREAMAFADKALRQHFPPKEGFIRGLHRTQHIDEELVWSEVNQALGQSNQQDFDDDFFEEEDYSHQPQPRKREPVTTWRGANRSVKPLPKMPKGKRW